MFGMDGRVASVNQKNGIFYVLQQSDIQIFFFDCRLIKGTKWQRKGIQWVWNVNFCWATTTHTHMVLICKPQTQQIIDVE